MITVPAAFIVKVASSFLAPAQGTARIREAAAAPTSRPGDFSKPRRGERGAGQRASRGGGDLLQPWEDLVGQEVMTQDDLLVDLPEKLQKRVGGVHKPPENSSQLFGPPTGLLLGPASFQAFLDNPLFVSVSPVGKQTFSVGAEECSVGAERAAKEGRK